MIWQLLILAVALGTNNALASIALGTSCMQRMTQIRTALVFALFEAGMPLLGIWLGEQVAGIIGARAKMMGIIIVIIVGLWSLLKKEDNNASVRSTKSLTGTIILAIALSLDNLSVGLGLGMLEVSLLVAAIVFGFVSLTMTLVGLEIGRFLSSWVKVPVERLSGAILLIVAGFMIFI